MLIVFSGLPGVGKTSIAKELARRLDAVYVRIDSIEQALRASRSDEEMYDAGYRAAYAVAEDNLRLGRTVVADSVNAIAITRDSWCAVATRVGVRAVEVEVLCSDRAEHRHRVETRTSDVPGLKLPAWADVTAREYEPWTREHLMVDTAARTVDESVNRILKHLR